MLLSLSLSIKENQSHHQSNKVTESTTNEYYIGVAMTFASALTAGLAMVLSAKAKEYCSNNLLMAVVGASTFLVGLMGPLFNLDNRFLTNLETWKSSSDEMSTSIELVISFGVAILSLVGIILLIVASQICPPIIVSLVRSSEILSGLFLEKVILFNLIPEMIDKIDERILFWLVFGALLVLFSVISMSLSDWIQQYIDSCKMDKEKDEEKTSNLVEEHEVKLLNEKIYMED